MILSELPVEVIAIVFEQIIGNVKDFISLASTCKRLRYIACEVLKNLVHRENKKDKRLKYNYYELAHCRYVVKSKDPKSINQDACQSCQNHITDISLCNYNELIPIWQSRFLCLTSLELFDLDLSEKNCILSVESSQLDRITELKLHFCRIVTKSLYRLLSKMKNVIYLKFEKNDFDRVHNLDDVPHVHRTLKHLELIDYNGSNMTRVGKTLALPCFDLPAKIVTLFTASDESLSRSKYIKRYKDHIERLRVFPAIKYRAKGQRGSQRVVYDWARVQQDLGLEKIRLEIMSRFY